MTPKHTFEIGVKELKNIPILAKFIREARDYQKGQNKERGTYQAFVSLRNSRKSARKASSGLNV